MAANKPKLSHINSEMSKEQRDQAERIRDGAMRDFPPKPAIESPPPSGLPRRLFEARQRRGMTRYELAKISHVPSTIVRDIEQGIDVPMSQFRAVAAALGLEIELVEQT